jgi:hypothetical protein
MKSLVFIQMLHRQGLEQASAPEPLSFSAILTFHDAVELFLITAAEHLGAAVKDRGRFPDRFAEALHPSNCQNGVDLQALYGIRRLTDLRNGFKHSAGFPGPEPLQRASTDTADFFTANSPLVFGLPFEDIDPSTLIQQPAARDRVKASAEHYKAGDLLSAMGMLAFAFERLMEGQMNDVDAPYGLSVFSFGPSLRRHGLRGDQVRQILDQPDMRTRRGLPARSAERLAEEITATRDVARSVQDGMRLMALGVDFHQYRRFLSLTPAVGMTYDQPHTPTFQAEDGYAPSGEEFNFCRQFVVSVALRIDEINRTQGLPSWRRGGASSS